VSAFDFSDLKVQSCEEGNVPRTILRAVDVTERDSSGQQVRSNFVSSYEPLTDEEGGSTTIHHCRYGSTPIPSSKHHLDFEV
jgi:hypothetical protein